MTDQLSFFGLGKLGLPLAALFARSGIKTVGIDVNASLIARLQAGETPYVTEISVSLAPWFMSLIALMATLLLS